MNLHILYVDRFLRPENPSILVNIFAKNIRTEKPVQKIGSPLITVLFYENAKTRYTCNIPRIQTQIQML